MGDFQHWVRGLGWGTVRAAVMGVAVALAAASHAAASSGKAAASGAGSTRGRPPAVSPWDAALRGRAVFEAEAKGRHTRAEYARVMEPFRAIYHGDPADPHAARSIEQVAELLAEEGREFNDKKILRDAAGQWEFLAKGYPGGTLAAVALGQALEVLGPQGVDDAAEAKRVRAELIAAYPRSAAAKAARQSAVVVARAGAAAPPRSQGRDEGRTAAMIPTHDDKTVMNGPPEHPGVRGGVTVTGIRHWSTASYTRVAIDLAVQDGDEVKYQAVRVENPDRIFFDVQDAKLAAGLDGKTFSVTDDEFLTRVRAGQVGGDKARVVLDVHQVGTYSAFVLPNPYRLIIDIHGKARDERSETRDERSEKRDERGPEKTGGVAMVTPKPGAAAEMSTLPPMPVTDGSAGFGLPARGTATRAAEGAERPRVVIPSAATTARPVPNTVSSTTGAGNEVAALSEQPGRLAATRRPTSQPVSSGSLSGGSSANGMGDHYVSPRARAAAVPVHDDGTVMNPTPAGKERSPGTLDGPPGHPLPQATTAGETTLMRALGLKIGRIVIDAGHGGHDVGTLGAGGIQEKDVVLDVALRLGKLLHERLGAQIVYTRADDTFIPLETRTAIANKAQADLFISVHANSSPDASARGVEVYYLNFTSDPDAMTVASRENAVSTQSVHELSDLVKKIALKDKIDESRELAGDVDAALYAGLRKGNDGLKDRGVKKAPFVVLIGANMPSILAEISFVTNPDDADQLQTSAYRERVAESLCKGVERYAAGINGVKTKAAGTERAAVK
jgi:N-acetylmuramoyl-L-alanine amidase